MEFVVEFVSTLTSKDKALLEECLFIMIAPAPFHFSYYFFSNQKFNFFFSAQSTFQLTLLFFKLLKIIKMSDLLVYQKLAFQFCLNLSKWINHFSALILLKLFKKIYKSEVKLGGRKVLNCRYVFIVCRRFIIYFLVFRFPIFYVLF